MTKIKIPIEDWSKQMSHIHFNNADEFSNYIENLINDLFEYHERRLICEALEKAHNELIKENQT